MFGHLFSSWLVLWYQDVIEIMKRNHQIVFPKKTPTTELAPNRIHLRHLDKTLAGGCDIVDQNYIFSLNIFGMENEIGKFIITSTAF